VPIDQYAINLEKLVTRLSQTKAKLIWASTTLVPEKEAGRRVGDELKYNAIAKKLLGEQVTQSIQAYLPKN